MLRRLSLLCNSQTRYSRPTLLPLSHLPSPRMSFSPISSFFYYSLYQTKLHALNCNESEKTALPQEEFMDNRLLSKFHNFSIKVRCCPIVKHRQNVEKRSLRKLTFKIPNEGTLWTTLNNDIRIRCKFFRQFRKLALTIIGLTPLQ